MLLRGRAHPMRGSGIHLEFGALDQRDRHARRCANRDDLVVITVENERRNIEPLEVFREVGFRKRFNAIVERLEATGHALQPEGPLQSLRNRRTWTIGAVERNAHIVKKLRTIGGRCIERLHHPQSSAR